jgi:hypothetical protein
MYFIRIYLPTEYPPGLCAAGRQVVGKVEGNNLNLQSKSLARQGFFSSDILCRSGSGS